MILILMFIASICMVFMSNNVSAFSIMSGYNERGFVLSDLAYTNVCKGKTATITDYKGNSLNYTYSPNCSSNWQAQVGLGWLTDENYDSWRGISPVDAGGNRTLGWFTIDMGANYYIDSVIVSAEHDWNSTDFVIQIAQDSAFTKGVRTVYNNDLDNTLGLGSACSMDPLVPVTQSLNNYLKQDFGKYANINKYTDINGIEWVLNSAVYGRYIRVTNNIEGGKYTSVHEISCFAPISNTNDYGKITGATVKTTNINGTTTNAPTFVNNNDNYPVDDWNVALQDGAFSSYYTAKLSGDGWVVLDLGQPYWIDRIDIGMFHDWLYEDVIVQTSLYGENGYGFSISGVNCDVNTIFSNDYNNTYGYGFGSVCTNEIIAMSSADTNNPSASLVWTYNVSGCGAIGMDPENSGHSFLFAPVRARYIRYRSTEFEGNISPITEICAYGSMSQSVNEALNNVATPAGETTYKIEDGSGNNITVGNTGFAGAAKYKLVDYQGNELKYLKSVTNGALDISGDGAASIFGLGNHSAYTAYTVRSSASGANQKAWLYIDLQRTFAIHEIDFSFYYDWHFEDVVIQVASNADFSDAVNILNTDIDNSTGANASKEVVTYDSSKSNIINYLTGVFDHSKDLDWYNARAFINGTKNDMTSGYVESNGHRMTFHDRPVRARYVRITNGKDGYSVFSGVKILAADRNGIVDTITNMPTNNAITITAGQNTPKPTVNYFGWTPNGALSETVAGEWISYDSAKPFNKNVAGEYQVIFASSYGLTNAVGLADQVVTVTVELPAIEYAMQAGASIRYADPSGIRFMASLNKAQYEQSIAQGNTVQVGMIIAPYDYLTTMGEMTLDNAKYSNSVVIADSSKLRVEGDNLIVQCALVNILNQNYTRKFNAVAFMKITNGGNTTVIYADASDNVRSIYEVAIMAITDNTYLKGQEAINGLNAIINKVNSLYTFTIENGKAYASLKDTSMVNVYVPETCYVNGTVYNVAGLRGSRGNATKVVLGANMQELSIGTIPSTVSVYAGKATGGYELVTNFAGTYTGSSREIYATGSEIVLPVTMRFNPASVKVNGVAVSAYGQTVTNGVKYGSSLINALSYGENSVVVYDAKGNAFSFIVYNGVSSGDILYYDFDIINWSATDDLIVPNTVVSSGIDGKSIQFTSTGGGGTIFGFYAKDSIGEAIGFPTFTFKANTKYTLSFDIKVLSGTATTWWSPIRFGDNGDVMYVKYDGTAPYLNMPGWNPLGSVASLTANGDGSYHATATFTTTASCTGLDIPNWDGACNILLDNICLKVAK